MTDVLVVGAGLAGLNCAVSLTERGHAVQVVDAADAVGGRVRTDLVDGHRCDRGFQLLNPAYPAARRYLDLPALQLRRFDAGVAVAGDRGVRVVADPVRAPRLLGRTLTSGYLRPAELLRLARWAAPAVGPVGALLRRADTELGVSLEGAKVRGRIRREILEPFLTGVLADDSGRTSATFARLLIRSFLLGTPGVPAAGMAAMPDQLADRLREPVRLGVRAVTVRRSDGTREPSVQTESGWLSARAVVVATDPTCAGSLLDVPAPRMNGLVTYWFSALEPPTALRLLFVDGGGRAAGPVVNTAVLSHVAPSYAPAGRHLVQATTLFPGDSGEAQVRAQLTRMYRVSTTDWQLLIRHEIRQALPQQLPPLRRRQPVTLEGGLFVAGDHRDTASIQGALVSGRRAADAVHRYLLR